jgi:hypothetical protein
VEQQQQQQLFLPFGPFAPLAALQLVKSSPLPHRSTGKCILFFIQSIEGTIKILDYLYEGMKSNIYTMIV